MTDIGDVDAVLWDIGGVILDLDSVQRVQREVVERLVTEYDSPYGVDEALAHWRETVGGYFAEREGTEFRPAREGYRRAVDQLLEPDPAAVPWQAVFHEARDAGLEPNPDAVAAIERLADSPVHQGIVSDIDHAEGRRILEGFDLRRWLDTYTSSEAVGRTKPDTAMFETALDRAGVSPEGAVMVGDRYEHDMAGAKRVGLYTVAYGAEDGPAVDLRLSDLRRLPTLLQVE